MSYRTILAILDSAADAAQTTDFAVALARQFDAHVIGLHVESYATMPVAAPMEIPDPAATLALQEQEHSVTSEVEKIFKEKARREGISHEWRTFVTMGGYSAAQAIDSARCADLIIAPQLDKNSMRSDYDQLLHEAGRPTLFVPYILKTPKPVKKALIAWNGSREAARSTFDAIPLLKTAEDVEIYTVDAKESASQSAETIGAEIASTLARHGVKVTLESQKSDGTKPAVMIENRLADGNIDLLVMGAYTHSPLWEVLFGGVTKELLTSMPVMTLMSR
jgi:nucleotide-binding universal stress UspA family protein